MSKLGWKGRAWWLRLFIQDDLMWTNQYQQKLKLNSIGVSVTWVTASPG
jgi:hypothetical protein